MELKICLKNSPDKWLSVFVSSYFLIQSINLYVKLTLSNYQWWNILSRILLGLLLVRSILSLSKKDILRLLLFETIVVLLFIPTVIHRAQTDEFSSIVFNALVVFIPMATSALAINDLGFLQKYLYRNAWFNFLIMALLCIRSRNSDYYYLMSVGYALLLNILIIMDHYFVSRKIIDLFAVFIGLMLILAMGSRGPLFCFLAFIILNVIFAEGRRLVKFSIASGLVVAFYLVAFYGRSLAMTIYEALKEIGFNSRTIVLFLSTSIFESYGRTSLLEYYMKKVMVRPVLGYGLAGGWRASGFYPHNIFVESLLSFGIVLGTGFIIGVIIIIIRGLRTKDIKRRRMSIVFISFIVSLVVSGSFVMTPEFYICMAICAGHKRNMLSISITENEK